MPVTAELPPFPSHDAFLSLREEIEAAKEHATDRRFLEVCDEQRRKWVKLAALLSADPGTPAKKLTVEERKEKRGLEAAEIRPEDIAALVAWFDKAIETLSRLRRARAA